MNYFAKALTLTVAIAAFAPFALADQISVTAYATYTPCETPGSCPSSTGNVSFFAPYTTAGDTGVFSGFSNSSNLAIYPFNYIAPNVGQDLLSIQDTTAGTTYYGDTLNYFIGSDTYGPNGSQSTYGIDTDGMFNIVANNVVIADFAGVLDFSTQSNGSTTDISISATGLASPAPEPGSLILLGTGLAGVAVAGRRKLVKV